MSTPTRLAQKARLSRTQQDTEQGSAPLNHTNEHDRRILPKNIQSHFVAMSGEFVGTVLFLFFAFAATQTANNLADSPEPDTNQLLFISLAFGFSLGNTAWVFYRVSGGLFNPAVRRHASHLNAQKL